jgi:predicted naringenin-chalcone synthase
MSPSSGLAGIVVRRGRGCNGPRAAVTAATAQAADRPRDGRSPHVADGRCAPPRAAYLRVVTRPFINAIATGNPPFEVHPYFEAFAMSQIRDRRRAVVERMMKRSGIERRYACLPPDPDPAASGYLDLERFYRTGDFPSTAARMRLYDREAAALAETVVRRLDGSTGAASHLIVTSCTGMAAPGVDLQLLARLGLPLSTERTLIGFMGCYAAINALRLAASIVRADPAARVLVVAVELCSLHLQETDDLEVVLSFMIFGDGCAAALVSAEPSGLAIDGFRTAVIPAAADLITWHVGERGFDMRLAGEVPATLGDNLPGAVEAIEPGGAAAIDLWAIHPGGRSVLDAAERGLALDADALEASRTVLRDYGNMSSPSVLFVLAEMLRRRPPPGARGLALAFGPGLTAEGMRFSIR